MSVPSRLVSRGEVGLEFTQLGHYGTEVRFFYTDKLYKHSTNHMVSFRAYASRDKSVEPDKQRVLSC